MQSGCDESQWTIIYLLVNLQVLRHSAVNYLFWIVSRNWCWLIFSLFKKNNYDCLFFLSSGTLFDLYDSQMLHFALPNKTDWGTHSGPEAKRHSTIHLHIENLSPSLVRKACTYSSCPSSKLFPISVQKLSGKIVEQKDKNMPESF